MSALPLMVEEAQFAAEFMELYLTPEQIAASAPRPPQLKLSPQPGKVEKQTSAWFCCALLCSRWSFTVEPYLKPAQSCGVGATAAQAVASAQRFPLLGGASCLGMFLRPLATWLGVVFIYLSCCGEARLNSC